MEKWVGKVAVVTGASAGIGEAIAKTLGKHGLTVVALARNEDKINRLSMMSKGKIHAIKCDIQNEKSVISAFKTIEEKFGGVDILINNAGIFNSSGLIDGSSKSWKDILETNVIGLSICNKQALRTMRQRGDNGHIINLNSVVGHIVPQNLAQSLGMYPPSKFAVTALTQMLREELRAINSKIKVTSISPGFVHTDMGLEAFTAIFDAAKPDMDVDKTPAGYLSAQDIADTVVAVLSFNLNVEVQELTVQSSQRVKQVNAY
ncbi:farnesol dehydrogenase-like [Arctopsyche grandis]|uniref:farnesol dehydrogenase-like n=1 Tax=Arctopsyche grandis TaxID=121162 RepID=UPI00406D6760